jgi:hypothetical protein
MKALRIFIILTGSILVILIPKKFATACGFYTFPGEYRFWLLQPDLTNQKDLTPFFFASTYLYKDDINAAVESYEEENVTEWWQQTKQRAARKDIERLLYHTAPQDFFGYEKQIEQQNSFLAWLNQPGNREFLQYFILSKKVEQVAATPDPWEEAEFPIASLNVVISEADSLYQKAASPFVKLRTTFQLIRLYGFTGQAEKLNRVYDARIEPVKSKSWIKTAALYQKALQAPAFEKDYLLSKVFDKGGYKRSYCLLKFKTRHTDSILLLAKNNHERTVIRAMQVFNYAGRSLSGIRRIYQAEPGYKDLAFVLLREINKVEDWLVTNKVTGFGTPAVYNENWFSNYEYNEARSVNYRSDKMYAKELYDFVLGVIKDDRQKDAALLKLYAAHLALLNSDMNASAQLLAGIKNEKDLPLNVRSQLAINRFLLHLEKGFDQETEDELMRIISKSPGQLGIYDAEIMKDQLILYTSRKLIKQGHKTKGLMLMSQTSRALGELPIGQYKRVYQELEENATPTVYDEILMTVTKKNKTAFEKLVSNPFSSPGNYYEYDDSDQWDRDKLLDCKASWYIRNHDLESALAVMKQLPDSFWSKEPQSFFIGGDPFFVNVYKPHGSIANDKLNLNKRQVVEAMIGLGRLAGRDPQKAAECYYQLANAWFNMTWYGKNWLMVKQWWSTNEDFANEELKRRPAFYKDYFGCFTAKEYYLKALKLTKDKNLASLCCYMAGVCEDHFQEYSYRLKSKDGDIDNYEAKPNPYTTWLKRKGFNSAVYEELVSECALYADFIRQYNKSL